MNKLFMTNEKDDRIITFSFLSVELRIVYSVIVCVVLAASVFVYVEQHRFPVLGAVLTLFSIFTLCYEDRWRFNCTKGTVEYRLGLVFLAYTRRYTFDDIERPKTERFTQGFRKHQCMKCVLYFKTGDRKTVAVFPVQRKKMLVRQWETLTALLTA